MSESVASLGAGLNISGITSAFAGLALGGALVLGASNALDSLGIDVRQLSITDAVSARLGFPVVQAMAMPRIRASADDYLAMVQGAIQAQVLTATGPKPDMHHPIPVYLCGRVVGQPMVPVDPVVHQFLHLSMISWTA
jgi:hypothetical protein